MFHITIITGRLGNDPTMAYTPDGKAVTKFSVAASNRKDDTTWFRITVFDKQAEICNQYLKKGSMVTIEGRLSPDKATGNPRVYERKDGGWAASFEVVASAVKFLSGKDELADQEIAF